MNLCYHLTESGIYLHSGGSYETYYDALYIRYGMCYADLATGIVGIVVDLFGHEHVE